MTTSPTAAGSSLESKIKHPPGKVATRIFGVVLAIGFVYAGSQLLRDLSHVHSSSAFPFILLGIALLVALAILMTVFTYLEARQPHPWSAPEKAAS